MNKPAYKLDVNKNPDSLTYSFLAAPNELFGIRIYYSRKVKPGYKIISLRDIALSKRDYNKILKMEAKDIAYFIGSLNVQQVIIKS